MSTWEIRAEAKALHEIWKSGSTPCGADVPAAVTTILILVRRVLALVEIAEAAALKRNFNPLFDDATRSEAVGKWVAVAAEDFEALRTARAKLEAL